MSLIRGLFLFIYIYFINKNNTFDCLVFFYMHAVEGGGWDGFERAVFE